MCFVFVSPSCSLSVGAVLCPFTTLTRVSSYSFLTVSYHLLSPRHFTDWFTGLSAFRLLLIIVTTLTVNSKHHFFPLLLLLLFFFYRRLHENSNCFVQWSWRVVWEQESSTQSFPKHSSSLRVLRLPTTSCYIVKRLEVALHYGKVWRVERRYPNNKHICFLSFISLFWSYEQQELMEANPLFFYRKSYNTWGCATFLCAVVKGLLLSNSSFSNRII